MNSKVKKHDGSAFTLVILAMALVSITMFVIYGQINNQIKSNVNSKEYIEAKYYAEAGVEKTIYDISEAIKYGVLNPNIDIYKSIVSTFASDNNDNIKMYLEQAISRLNSVSFQDRDNELLRDKLVNDIESSKNNCTITEILEFRQSCLNIIAGANLKDNVTSIYEAKNLIYIAMNNIYDDVKMHTDHKPETMDENGILRIGQNGPVGEIDQITNSQGRLWNAFNNLIQNGGINKDYKEEFKDLSDEMISKLRVEYEKIKNKLIDRGDSSSLINIVKSVQIDQNIPADINNPRIQEFITSIDKDLNLIIDMITEMQNTLDQVYINNSNRTNKDAFKNVIVQFNSMKQQLYEVKCKLGIEKSSSSGDNNGRLVDTNVKLTIYEAVIPTYNYPFNYSELNDNNPSNDGNMSYSYKRSQINFSIDAICDKYMVNDKYEYIIKSIEPITIEGSSGINSKGNASNKEVVVNPNIIFYPNADGTSKYSIQKWK